MDRLAFVCEWLDPSSKVLWHYQLFFYPSSGEVEMFDIKNRRHFLKRVKCDSVSSQQLRPGGTVVVFARQLQVLDYGDEATRRAVEARSERMLVLVKPGGLPHAGKVIAAITGSGLVISALRMVQLGRDDAEAVCAAAGAAHADAARHLASGPVVAAEVAGPGAAGKLAELLDRDTALAAASAPLLGLFFGPGSRLASCGRCSGTSLGLVKPSAVKEGLLGALLDGILGGGFDVTGLQMFCLDTPTAAEFLEVYKGVLPAGEFSDAVGELTSGPCVAVEVAPRGSAREPVEAFRQLCGPADPELGRVLRPSSLRARFGASRVRNAIHCTDLEEDGLLETCYFFALLQQGKGAGGGGGGHQQQQQQMLQQSWGQQSRQGSWQAACS